MGMNLPDRLNAACEEAWETLLKERPGEIHDKPTFDRAFDSGFLAGGHDAISSFRAAIASCEHCGKVAGGKGTCEECSVPFSEIGG